MAVTGSTAYARAEVERASAKWWVLLITGIAWIIVSVLVLDADLDSARTIGYLVGGYLIAAGVTELVLAGVEEGWKWLHIAMGVLFVVGGIAALTEPFRTFTLLAALTGFFLVVKGTFDFVMALVVRHEADLWWLLLIAGVLQVVTGFWASGYPGRSATLLVVWVGIGALFRGVTQLILAFQVRKLHEAVVR
jgi:uncharacterized membrane protein HdeD (DUF308 family)